MTSTRSTLCVMISTALLFVAAGLAPDREEYPMALTAGSITAQQCTDHMETPWVALYRDTDFQGDSICYVGVGVVDLREHGWADRASSVNIGANGLFAETIKKEVGGVMAAKPFSSGTRISDLRTIGWNDRIGQIQINN